METIIELIAKGCTVPQIAKEIKKSEASVWRLLRKHGLKTFRHTDHNPNVKTKRCRYCDKTKPIENFPLAGGAKDGGKYRRHKCQECTQNTKRIRRNKIRSQIASLKKTLYCERCGEDDFRLLDFHHNGNKSFNIADAVRHGYAWETIEQEIAKCEALCVKCHRIETFENLWGE